AVRGIKRMKNVFGPYMKSVGVVQPAVPRLRDQRQTPPISGRIGRAVFDSPLNDSISRDANAVRVRDHDWSLQESALFDPMRAGHLAVAVQTEHACVDRIVQ